MKKKTLLAVLIWFIVLNAYGDSTVEDLEKRLESVSGKEKAAVLKQIGRIYLRSNKLKPALGNYLKLLELEKGLGNKKGTAAALGNIGIIYSNLGDHTRALQYYGDAAEMFSKIGNKKGVAATFNNIGVTYWDLNDYDRALENHFKSLTIEEEIGNKIGIANNQNSIGNVYSKLEQYDKALEYYSRALKLFEELKSKGRVAICLSNIGATYERLKQYDKALEYYRQSLQIRESIGDEKGISISLNNMGVVYKNLGEYENAINYYQRSLTIDKRLGNQHSLILSLQNIGEAFIKLKKYKEALFYLEGSLKLAKKHNTIDLKQNIYRSMSALFAETGNYKKAYHYHEEYTIVKDRILNKESNDKIAEMQAKYDAEKKEKEIALLKKNNELLQKNGEIQNLRLSKERFKANAFIAGFILVFIIALLLFKKYLHLFAFWKKKNFIGHYRIIEQIGSGGMGVVYKATHVMERTKSAAIKVIREEYCADSTQRKRFMNEALMVDQLNHPHIVKVFERGEYNQQLYIAMELLEGQSLAERIKKGVHIPLTDCLKIMYQLIDTITSVHAKGIIHRDIKPENILLVEQGEDKNFVKLLDFGLARSESLTRLTETGEILGTINYLPPERISRQEYSAASDIYSLGVVFYEMVTLEKPFPGEVPIDIIKQIFEKEPIAPNKFRPEVPRELNGIILEMMNKDPGKRPSEQALLEIVNPME